MQSYLNYTGLSVGGDSSAPSLHLSTADKGIYFHIVGEYQYLSFSKKKK